MSLEDRLNVAAEGLDVSKESLERVRLVLSMERDGLRRKYSLFESGSEFKIFYNLHEDWQGETPQQAKDRAGRLAFTSSFLRFARRKTKDSESQADIMRSVFPLYAPSPKLNVWDKFVSQEDWDTYFTKNIPLWNKKKSKSQKRASYLAYRRWIIKTVPDDVGRDELIGKYFNGPYISWENLKTIDDIKRYYAADPKLQGKSPYELRRDNYGKKFYHFVAKKLNELEPDKSKRPDLMNSIISYKINSWKQCTQLVDWVRIYDSHPEWHGLTTKELREVPGGGAFYAAYCKWTYETSGNDKKKRSELKNVFLPDWRKINSINSALLQSRL